MAEFHPLSPQIQSEYSISSDQNTSLDDISLASSRNNTSVSRHNNNTSMSSSASVSSRFSRASRKSLKNSDLGVPLTSTSSLDERDEESGGGDTDGDWVGAAPPTAAFHTNGSNVTSPTTTTNKSYISEDDPFYMFRSDLQKKLSIVDDELDKYLTVVRTTDTAVNTHEVKETKKQLKRHLKHAESTLSDLETTVRVVERQREKFTHINDNEIMERRRFVDESKSRIGNVRGVMQGEDVKRKFVMDERALTERRRGDQGGGSGGGANGTKNQDYSTVESQGSNGEERSETMLMMQQQDETLDDLDMAVTRVGYMAETIHEEIDMQNVMLKSLEEDLADAEEQLGVVMGKLAKLLKTKSKCQIGLILMLSLIVLVLFFLVLYF